LSMAHHLTLTALSSSARGIAGPTPRGDTAAHSASRTGRLHRRRRRLPRGAWWLGEPSSPCVRVVGVGVGRRLPPGVGGRVEGCLGGAGLRPTADAGAERRPSKPSQRGAVCNRGAHGRMSWWTMTCRGWAIACSSI
jgi:hypothetical protein